MGCKNFKNTPVYYAPLQLKMITKSFTQYGTGCRSSFVILLVTVHILRSITCFTSSAQTDTTWVFDERLTLTPLANTTRYLHCLFRQVKKENELDSDLGVAATVVHSYTFKIF